MTQVASNVHRVEIVSSATALSALVASMPVGTWATLTTTGLGAAVTSTGSSGNICGFSNAGVWEPLDKKVHFLGADHGDAGLRHISYNEVTNAWVTEVFDIGSGGAHAYDHICKDNSGNLYSARYGSPSVYYKKPYGSSTWNLNFKSFPSVGNITYGNCFWSGALTGLPGSQGGIFTFEAAFGQIWVYDVQNDNFPILRNPAVAAITPGYQQVAAYNPISNVALFGGGTSSGVSGGWKALYRYSSNGTITQFTVPSGVLIGVVYGTLTEDPSTGNFLCLTSNNSRSTAPELYEINATTGAFTLQTGSRAPPSGIWSPNENLSPQASGFVVPIGAPHNVTMVVSAFNGTPASARVDIYKHA